MTRPAFPRDTTTETAPLVACLYHLHFHGRRSSNCLHVRLRLIRRIYIWKWETDKTATSRVATAHEAEFPGLSGSHVKEASNLLVNPAVPRTKSPRYSGSGKDILYAVTKKIQSVMLYLMLLLFWSGEGLGDLGAHSGQDEGLR